MAKVLTAHWPHLTFVGAGVIAFLWAAYRPERPSPSSPTPARDVSPVRPGAGKVNRSVARRGLLALGPLVAAAATGALLYALALAGRPGPSAVIWLHSGISALALALVLYKVSGLGADRLRRSFQREGLAQLASLALGLVSVPLAATGLGLLVWPDTRSVLAYTHLISSAWWTLLLVWHLRRYLASSLRAALRGAREQVGARGVAAPRRARQAAPDPARPWRPPGA